VSYRCLYLSPALTEAAILDEPQLATTTERHRLELDVPIDRSAAKPLQALDGDSGLHGVVIEMWLGWPSFSQLRLASAVLKRGKRVWLYWPNEGAVECIDRERISSSWRLWLLASAYMSVSRPSRRLAAIARAPGSLVRTMLGGKVPGEWRITVRVRSLIAALRERVAPVPFRQSLPPSAGSPLKGTGIYLRLDFWARIMSGGSYGHTCYVAKELAAVTERLECFMAAPYVLLDEMGVPQHVLPPPADPSGENVIVEASRHYFLRLRREIAALPHPPAYIYERLVLGNFAGAMLSQSLSIPYIVEYNGSELSMRRSFDQSRYIHEDIYLRAEALAFEQATVISVVSAEVKASLVARGVPAEKVFVNPNGADLDAYAPPSESERRATRRELGFSDDDRVVGFSGTFGGWHGVDVLAAAIPRICRTVPAATFLLIGDGPYKRLVDAAVAENRLGDRVVSTGRVSQVEGARLLKACDIYVSPHSSHMVDSKFFGSPTKLFEYMAMAGGIVASDLEQIGEVMAPALRPSGAERDDLRVTDERGVLCQPGSVDEFVAGVTALVRKPALCQALGRNARQAVADHFSWKKHVARLWNFASSQPARSQVPARKRYAFIGRLRLSRLLGAAPPPEEAPAVLPAAPDHAIETSDAYKDEAQRQWNNDPAGAHYVKHSSLHTLEWFEEAAAYRYGPYAPWMRETMEFERHAGHRVLEIGGGMGTDLAEFARHGAIVTDVDLSSGHLALARENFTLRGLRGEFVLHDAERLPFDSDWFDVVYSNGVLHHTPNTHAVVGEILRVLKPGGRAIVMMYAENSLHYWRNLVWTIGLKESQLLDHSMGDIMSRTVERSDNAAARPLVKVYTKERLRNLFAGFADIEIVQRQMVHAEVPRMLTKVPVASLGKLMGWNLIIKARKPSIAAIAGSSAAPAETGQASGRR
jgi:glycosyltransferase involved in cell wall biosynthesis/ubiquinone/menaquinone biosynthesis C-methylase UbiE